MKKILSNGVKMEYLSQWRQIAEVILKAGEVVIVLGGTDTGKTTFVTYLANFMFREGKRAAVVDADVGQSDIGPPTTIGMGIMVKPVNSLREVPVSDFYFVGSISPAGYSHQVVTGTEQMVKKGMSLGAEVVIVDTSGLVYGQMGWSLKARKIEAIGADHIVALQREAELEVILRPFEPTRSPRSAWLKNVLLPVAPPPRSAWLKDVFLSVAPPPRIHRLKVPEGLKRKSLEARRMNRQERLQDFFKDSASFEISFSDVRKSQTLYATDNPLKRKEDFEGTLVGLVEEGGQLLCLGRVEKIDFFKERITISAPLKEKEKIKAFQFSEFKF